MPNRQLLQSIQRRQRELRLSEMDSKPIVRNEYYAKKDDLSSIQSELESLREELATLRASKPQTQSVHLSTVQRSVSIPVTVDQGGTGLTNNNYVYIGGSEAIDGTWRFSISGTDLIAERRESGVWVNKGGFTA